MNDRSTSDILFKNPHEQNNMPCKIGLDDLSPLASTNILPNSNLMGPNHPYFINQFDQTLHNLDVPKNAKYDPISTPGIQNNHTFKFLE